MRDFLRYPVRNDGWFGAVIALAAPDVRCYAALHAGMRQVADNCQLPIRR